MEIKKITGENIKDIYYKVSHPAGLDIYVYPKNYSNMTYAIFGTKYGSIDNCFKRSDEAKSEEVPEGIAHYLEHKLFESEDGDAFSRFAETGASANAFTSFDSTCYLFAATDKVYDSLEILLDFVQSPYFTDETVAKEQGIIAQEIKMYDDDPQWKLFFNHMKSMYHNHPICKDIAGTVESISQITPKLLYRCYDTFYNLHNMALCVVGNVELEKVLEICDKMLKPSEPVVVNRIFKEEPADIVTPYVEEKMSVASPLFQFGYKENVISGERTEMDVAASEVLLDIIASDASPLFRSLLDEGLVNESSFNYSYFEGTGFANAYFEGESKDPKRTAQMIKDEIARIKKDGIDKETFERSRRAVYGENVGAMNNAANIARGIVNRVFKNCELFKYIDAFSHLTIQDVEQKLESIFDDKHSSLSVILPL